MGYKNNSRKVKKSKKRGNKNKKGGNSNKKNNKKLQALTKKMNSVTKKLIKCSDKKCGKQFLTKNQEDELKSKCKNDYQCLAKNSKFTGLQQCRASKCTKEMANIKKAIISALTMK